MITFRTYRVSADGAEYDATPPRHLHGVMADPFDMSAHRWPPCECPQHR